MKAWIRFIIGVGLSWAALFAGEGALAEETLVLDESCYMRSYHQFQWDRISAQALKSAKPEDPVLSKRTLQRLERGVKGRLAHLKLDWSKEDWRDHAVLRFASPNAGIQDNPEDERYMNFPPPPPNWAAADFDDSDWPRRRRPFLVGRPEVGFGVMNFGVRASYHRMRLFVPDPAVCGDLALSITYRGGVRLFANGKEAARKNIPAGEYDALALADPYPVEAYIRTPEEYHPEYADRVEAFLKEGRGQCPALVLLPEMFGPMPAAGHDGMIACHRGTTSVTPETWRRIQAVRERTLDKVRIAVPPYQPPAAAPEGATVPLGQVDAQLLQRHSILAGTPLTHLNWMRANDENKPCVAPATYFAHGVAHPADLKGLAKTYETGLWVRPHHESVYTLEGSGLKGFAAEVGFPTGMEDGRLDLDARVNFEIWLDGKAVAQSGFMSVGDEPRLLAVTGLERAKELKLVTRLSSLKDSDRCLVFWADPRFYR